ncbi:hypothetical protein A3K80_08475 [Candidatus Bathyarchaeota archaeon RBG_13_38_9]|nr:MAG: hypothetical protein A3K80_08475 [Candidatus Bathyarchaeota archaeon RBG_13_38_9]
MNLNFWISNSVTLVIIAMILILLTINIIFTKNTGTGRYWVLIWIPIGWLISLPLAEWLIQILFQFRKSLISGWETPLIILWIIAFSMLLLGFLPQFRPTNRKDRINLLGFSVCWTAMMMSINIFWFRFIMLV